MELIHTTEDLIYLYHLKNLLETAGVESLIKNDRLSTLSGEIPMTNCWPELWIVDDSKLELANKVIDEVNVPLVTEKGYEKETWVCDKCGEIHSVQFSDCWNCHSIENDEYLKTF